MDPAHQSEALTFLGTHPHPTPATRPQETCDGGEGSIPKGITTSPAKALEQQFLLEP